MGDAKHTNLAANSTDSESIFSWKSRDVRFLGLLAAVHGSLDLMLSWFAWSWLPSLAIGGNFSANVLSGMRSGLLLGQTLILCGWVGLGPGRYLQRMLISLGIIVVMVIIGSGGSGDRLSGLGQLVVALCILQMPYLLIRKLWLWRVEHHSEAIAVGGSVSQFSIVHLIGLTTLIGVTLAIIRAMQDDLFTSAFILSIFVVPVATSLCLLWAGIGPGRRTPIRYAVVVLVLTAVLEMAIQFVSFRLAGGDWNWRTFVNSVVSDWQLNNGCGFHSVGVTVAMSVTVLLAAFWGYELRNAQQD